MMRYIAVWLMHHVRFANVVHATCWICQIGYIIQLIRLHTFMLFEYIRAYLQLEYQDQF